MSSETIMQDIINSIQEDILNPNVKLSNILLKAKVLAYQLENDEFKQWIRQEINGYEDEDNIPNYRFIPTNSYGYMTNGYTTATHIPISTFSLPDWLRDQVQVVKFNHGVRSIEEISATMKEVSFDWPAEWLGILNQTTTNSFQYLQARRPVSSALFTQMLDVIRSKLQDFVLEISGLHWRVGQPAPPSEQISHIFNITIANSAQGGSMSTFDQRGQQVQYQYNAAGNINFAHVQDQRELVVELEKLQTEVEKASQAGVIDQSVAVDVEYQLKKALQEVKKPAPDKKGVLQRVQDATTLIGGVAAASGLIKGFAEAAEAIQKILQ
jgi:YD repeat-containing protein